MSASILRSGASPESRIRISVLLAAYNGEKYIGEQLASIVAQYRSVDEIVVIDDCSSDTTLDVVRNIARENDRRIEWVIERNATNHGWCRTFAEGVRQTTGDVVFFCDQDDVWLPDKTELFLNALFSDGSYNVVASTFASFNSNPAAVMAESVAFSAPKARGIPGEFGMRGGGGCTMAFRRSYYNAISGYYISGWAHDDFLWRMSLTDGSLVFVDRPSILRRFHGGNQSTRLRTLDETIASCEIRPRICDSQLAYIVDWELDEAPVALLRRERAWWEARGDLLKSPSMAKAIATCACYANMYPRKRQIVGDYLLAKGWLRR